MTYIVRCVTRLAKQVQVMTGLLLISGELHMWSDGDANALILSVESCGWTGNYLSDCWYYDRWFEIITYHLHVNGIHILHGHGTICNHGISNGQEKVCEICIGLNSYPSVTQAKKAGCFSLQYSPNSHLMHTQCSSNAHLVQGHIFRNFLAIHT